MFVTHTLTGSTPRFRHADRIEHLRVPLQFQRAARSRLARGNRSTSSAQRAAESTARERSTAAPRTSCFGTTCAPRVDGRHRGRSIHPRTPRVRKLLRTLNTRAFKRAARRFLASAKGCPTRSRARRASHPRCERSRPTATRRGFPSAACLRIHPCECPMLSR
jgi:hypothetical protein